MVSPHCSVSFRQLLSWVRRTQGGARVTDEVRLGAPLLVHSPHYYMCREGWGGGCETRASLSHLSGLCLCKGEAKIGPG